MTTQPADQLQSMEEQTLDDKEPGTPVQDVARIGGSTGDENSRPDVEAASNSTLENKMEEYETQGTNLVTHHDWAQNRFDLLLTEYTRFFLKLDVFGDLSKSIKAVLPEFRLQEEFSFFELEGALGEAMDAIEEYLLVGTIVTGAVGSLAGVSGAINSWQTSKLKYAGKNRALANELGNQTLNRTKITKARSGVKWAGRVRVLRGAGIVGAVLGVGTAGLSIYAALKNKEGERKFLEDAVMSFQGWYEGTQANYDALKGGIGTMEEDFRVIMRLLGVIPNDAENTDITEARIDALQTALDGLTSEAGKKVYMVETAARIYCRDSTASNATVAALTGLDVIKLSDVKAQINGPQGTKICERLRPPSEPVTAGET